MKTKKALIVIICFLVVIIGFLISIIIFINYQPNTGSAIISSSLTYITQDIPDSLLTSDSSLGEYDRIVYDYVSVAAYKFKNPSSVRVISGSYIGEGENIDLYLQLSATNGFGATTTGYYCISDGGNWCLDLESDLYVDLQIESGFIEGITFAYSLCKKTDVFNVNLINKMLAQNWDEKLGLS